ncbi:MAG: hypothetical protein M1825_005977 [Sarcosagium campestre]|nr:MAG: hypothetical protein M1825_005977 [Sarcosagium campestre]
MSGIVPISMAQDTQELATEPAPPVIVRDTNDEILNDSSASDSEYQHALEVVFDKENDHRRKSSLVSSQGPPLARSQRRDTACFVHALLSNRDREGRESQSTSLRGDGGIIDQKYHEIDSSGGHSRLLSKKQLSEVALGVRELSKRLGNLRMKLRVRRVFLLTKAHDETLIQYTREVAKWLLSQDQETSYTVYVEKTLQHNKHFNTDGLVAENAFYGDRLKFWTNELCRQRPQTFDFVITLGGDGTVLYASWLFQHVVPPVLSFALGSLGFLTSFDYHAFRDNLTTAFKDGVAVSLRLRFEGTIMRSQRHGESNRSLVEELIGEEVDDHRTHKPDGSYTILNDIVVDRGPNPSELARTRPTFVRAAD